MVYLPFIFNAIIRGIGGVGFLYLFYLMLNSGHSIYAFFSFLAAVNCFSFTISISRGDQ